MKESLASHSPRPRAASLPAAPAWPLPLSSGTANYGSRRGGTCPPPSAEPVPRALVHARSCSPAPARRSAPALPAPPFVHVALSPGVLPPSCGQRALPPRGAPVPFLLAWRGGACGGTRKWWSEAVSLATQQESGGPVPSACASALGAAAAAPRGAGSGRDGPEPGLAAAGSRPRP